MVKDKVGNLYGATQLGGKRGLGTVFKLSPAGKETILHNFSGGSGGGALGAGVILDSTGNIYGTTFIGGDLNCNPGQGCGVVFKVDISGHETVLHTFEGSDGASPWSPLIPDSAGNLYGTTQAGGDLGLCSVGLGCGVVFELSPNSDGTWSETVLYKFCSASNCTDGKFPSAGTLIQDAAGNLYGTTIEGGANTGCSGGNGCGVVFELNASGKETVLHNFTGGTDGNYPLTGVTMDKAGNLYGTATSGGNTKCNPPTGCGTVFKLSL